MASHLMWQADERENKMGSIPEMGSVLCKALCHITAQISVSLWDSGEDTFPWLEQYIVFFPFFFFFVFSFLWRDIVLG